MIVVVLNSLLHIIVGLIPGFRVFPFIVPASFCGPEIYTAYEVNFNFYNWFTYYEVEFALGLCFLLYIWCAISIFYQVLVKTNMYPKTLNALCVSVCLFVCLFVLSPSS
jgi:hypothetical protein